eukprot:1069873-Amphidinium_carterae.1
MAAKRSMKIDGKCSQAVESNLAIKKHASQDHVLNSIDGNGSYGMTFHSESTARRVIGMTT